MIVRTLTVGPFQENCYLVIDETTRAAAFVDPGGEGDRLVAALDAEDATLRAIWLTHGHVDHIGGIAAIHRAGHVVPIHLHPADLPLYRKGAAQAAFYGIPFESPGEPDIALAEGALLELGELSFTVLHTPGHAPGLCTFVGQGCAFVGDLLFAGSIGRTDLPLSNPPEMAVSLERIAGLPADTVVYAGHGPVTTIGEELATNPFLNGIARVAGAPRE